MSQDERVAKCRTLPTKAELCRESAANASATAIDPDRAAATMGLGRAVQQRLRLRIRVRMDATWSGPVGTGDLPRIPTLVPVNAGFAD